MLVSHKRKKISLVDVNVVNGTEQKISLSVNIGSLTQPVIELRRIL